MNKPNDRTDDPAGLDSVVDSLEIQSRVGYMPQKFGLYQDLTVMENLKLYADLQGVALKTRHHRFDKLLTMTDLAVSDHGGRHPAPGCMVVPAQICLARKND